ncbi:MAG: hypothetical protein ACFFB3_17200 [Candidatus Hodarchaeota archaeon]
MSKRGVLEKFSESTLVILYTALLLLTAYIQTINALQLTSLAIPMENIVIDGNVDDWQGIEPILHESFNRTEWINIDKAWITNDAEFLYIRILYDQEDEYNQLWANITCELDDKSYYLLSAFAPGQVGIAWILDENSLNWPITGGEEFFIELPDHAAMDSHDTRRNIEFKIPLNVLGNSDYLILVFWHWDTFRAVDGYLTYYMNEDNQQGAQNVSQASQESK